MANFSKIIMSILVLSAVLIPITVQALSIVPCGGPNQQPCKFEDLIILAKRLINYLLSASAVVAAYYIVISGWEMMSAMGNPEKLQKAKTALTQAVIGFSLILLSFVFINLVLGIFGIDCAWWTNPSCIYN